MKTTKLKGKLVKDININNNEILVQFNDGPDNRKEKVAFIIDPEVGNKKDIDYILIN